MNSKIFFFFIFLLLNACGVKNQPLRPAETAISSYVKSYTGLVKNPKSLPEKKK